MSTPAQKDPAPPARLQLIRPAAFDRHYFDGAIKRSLRENIGLRIIALLLAISLWLFVNAGQHGSVESFNVPISYRGLPPHFVITNAHPETVKVEVSGPRTLLSLIEPSRLTLKIDLHGVGVGQAFFKVGLEAFNVPRQTTVVGISPSQLVLDIDQIVKHEMPVHLVLTGKPPNGYRVSSTAVSPSKVMLRGPSKELASIEQVATEPLDVTGINSDDARVIPLTAPSATMRIDPPEVTANIGFSEVIGDKEFHAIPLQVRNSSYDFRIEPPHVNVTVRGPVLALEQLDLANYVALDAAGRAPGNYNVPLAIVLPEGLTVVHQSAVTINLRIYHRKRTGAG